MYSYTYVSSSDSTYSDASHGASADATPRKRREFNERNQPIKGGPTTQETDGACTTKSVRFDSKSKIPLSLKMIQKNRIARSKFINIRPYAADLHTEVMKPPLKKFGIMNPGFKPRPFKTHDRNLEDFKPKTNPFDLPELKRTFYPKKIKKHPKDKTDPFIMSEPRTICDVDENFYKEIEGRPIRQFVDIKVYMENLRAITLWRTNAAFAKERIIQIEHHHAYEMDQFNKVLRLYRRSKNNFVQFVKETFLDAKRFQDVAEETSMKLASVTDTLEHYSFRYVELRNQVANITYFFNNLSMYRRFLYSLSPITWRREHDPLFIDYSNSTNSFIHAYLDLNNSQYVMPPIASIDKFRKRLRPDERGLLYFKDPRQLTSVFDELRKQCVTYVEIDVVTSRLVKAMVKCRNQLKTDLAITIADLKDWIISIESEIIFFEDREKAYKEAFEKLLMTEFQKLFSSHENIKLFTCVQYVNVRLIGGHEEPKDSVATLMCDVENLYYDLNMQLDNLNQEVVRAAKKEMFAEDKRAMKRAHKAKRILTEYERLSKSLHASFEPPRNKTNNTIYPKKNQIKNECTK